MQFNIIHVNWDNGHNIISNAFDHRAELDHLPDEKNVLYQIYGYSPIYGSDALLYIGITKESIQRIKQHLKGIFGRGLDLFIRIGKIDNLGEDQKRLELTESILINLHKPSYNSEYLHNLYCESFRDYYMILNHGSRGALMLECSNIWWSEQVQANKDPISRNTNPT